MPITTSQRGTKTAAIRAYFRGGVANISLVRALCPLPETAFELACVARSLGAPETQVFIGPRATETAIKAATLDRYRILYFATHDC